MAKGYDHDHEDDHHRRVRRRRRLALDSGVQFVPVGDDGEETAIRADVLLVDEEAIRVVRRELRDEIEEVETVDEGLFRVLLAPGRDVVGTARELDEITGRGRVAPEHLLSFGSHALWIGDEQPDPAPKQSALPKPHPDGVRIGLVDTSVDTRHPWLRSVAQLGNVRQRTWADTPELGHGTFVAGVLRQRLPEARLVCAPVELQRARRRTTGLSSEVDVAAALLDLLTHDLDDDPIDIVNLSLGAASTHTGMLAVDRAVRRAHQQRCGRPFALVASAGNAGNRIPFVPAAEPYVVGVAALVTAEPPVPAGFTNRGTWVSASAEGVDIVSSFPAGLKIDGVTFGPFARWSGTSFAAPTVTTAIAATALDAGVSAPAAAQLVMTNPAHAILPDLGVVVPTP